MQSSSFFPGKEVFLSLFEAARVVKLVYTPDLGSGAVRGGGSSPPSRTNSPFKNFTILTYSTHQFLNVLENENGVKLVSLEF